MLLYSERYFLNFLFFLQIIDKKPVSSDVDVSQEELTKTLENIANL